MVLFGLFCFLFTIRGTVAVVVECVPAALGAEITAQVKVPTIGIGAGPRCDGQILVIHDLLGLPGGMEPTFVKRYDDLGARMDRAFRAYRQEVEDGTFPAEEHSY